MLLVVAIQLIIQMHIELWCRRLNLHFIFPKVVQAHTLGEVGNCDTVLLRVYSGTILAIFIEVGSYLTDKYRDLVGTGFMDPIRLRCHEI